MALAAPGVFTLSATPGCNGGSPQIALNWTAAIGAETYELYRDGSLYSVGIPSSSQGFVNTNVSPGATYRYFVRARNATGTTDSNTLQAPAPTTCGIATTIPGAPQNFTAFAGDGQNSLFWNAPSSNGGSTITSYRVFRGTNSSNRLIVTSGGCANLNPVTSCKDTGLTNGQNYDYIVSAVNGVGTGPPSNVVTATPVAAGTGPIIGDPSFSATGSLATPRYTHTATLLPNGKVLIAGGQDGGILSSVELYDLAVGKFSATTGLMTTARANHTATLLPSGKVLIVGGYNGAPLSSAELYDPVSGTFSPTGPLITARYRHTATLLPNGKVLIAGGQDGGVLSSAELYDPASGTFSATAPLITARAGHTATLLPNGMVLIAGGLGAAIGLFSAELFDPASGTFSATGSLITSRASHTATLLPNGKVLIAGGNSAELYDPASKTFSATGPLATARAAHTATLLPNGTVLIVGGNNGPYLSQAEVYDPASKTFSATAPLATARDSHTATLLPSGRVLIIGGANDFAEISLSSAELYDSGNGTFSATVGSLTTARDAQTATLLPNGKVLIVGGNKGTTLSSAELYDPASGTFSATGPLAAARFRHTATLLPNGKVLITGGYSGSGTSLSSAELYDLASGMFSTTNGALAAARAVHTATLLPNGTVLIVGGYNNAESLDSAELFDPASGTFSRTTGLLTTARATHTATLLPNGKVLIVGGYKANGGLVSSAELYDPATGTFNATTGRMATARVSHTATLLPNGEVLIAGGTNNAQTGGALSSEELYEPTSGTFSTTGSLAAARYQHTATLLPNGEVLIAGGSNSGYLSSAELYDPASGTFNTAGPLATARAVFTATLLPNGKVLIAGGVDSGSNQTSAELFSTDFSPTRRPSITSFPSTIRFGIPFTITGSQFRGDSESSGGTTSSSGTNYPLVSLFSLEGSQIAWLVPDSRCSNFTTCNLWDDPMTLKVSTLPPSLNPGWQLLTVITNGVSSVSSLVQMTCGPPVITTQPLGVTTVIGATATLSVVAQGGRAYQWRQDGVKIPGATNSSYTTPPIKGPDAGLRLDVVVDGGCGSVTSETALVTVADSTPPTASLVSPNGGEYLLLSTPGNPPNTKVVTWTMSDNVRVCRVAASLLYSNDGGTTYVAAPSGAGLPASFGSAGSCPSPGESTTSLTYTVPTTFPSGRSGSLYKIQVVVTDQAGNTRTVASTNPFYIVQANPDSVKTLILWNNARMVSRQGISAAQAAILSGKLQELANHPRVQGLVIDLSSVTAIQSLYSAWDADQSNASRANAVLFDQGGIHDYLTTNLLAAYSGVKYLVIVGDDRIIPMARIEDHTVLLPESSYPAGGDLTPSGTTVGQALAANKYLTDDPLTVLGNIAGGQLDGSLFLPDLAVGRLVETPQQIITTIATYISQDGILDLSTLDPANGHKVLVTGYDFFSNVATQERAQWKSVLHVSTPDTAATPVDGSLIGSGWGLGSVQARASALRTKLSGNGGPRYGVMAIAGHATHYEEGVPGNDALDIQGLSTADIYGADACNTNSAGSLDLAGGVVYAIGCHGGLSVPGSCRTDANHSLDLPETMLARGAVGYIANSGYGWSLRFGIGYSARLSQIFTEQMTIGGTIAIGDAVRQSKQRYYLETPRYDPYDEKTIMQWTLYGLPMYAVKTGIASGTALRATKSSGGTPESTAEERLGAIRVRRLLRTSSSATSAGIRSSAALAPASLPSSLTQLSVSFDFTGNNVYEKHDSSGKQLPAGPGCPDVNGCYYTLNGLVDRGTGSADLPIEPYVIYDSRLSGTSQHGVLWKGGTYDEESGWTPVIAQLVSNGGDGSNHGSAPRKIILRPTVPRALPGLDSPACRPSDLEVSSLTVTLGEAVKNQLADPIYSIMRRYRSVDLEVFYFNNRTAPTDNCDRTGPSLGTGPFGGDYHQLTGSTISWAVPAMDSSGVWRVLVVYTTNAVDAQHQGTWTPLDLTNDNTGTFRGNLKLDIGTRLTYVIEVVDNRGNVSWLDYVTAQLPSSGTVLGVPKPIDVLPATDPSTGRRRAARH